MGERLRERDSSSDNVREQARFLATHGQGVLAGDFAGLHRNHDRLVAATVANRQRQG
jgi:hypothetical protein